MTIKTARLFINGRSQAVRLPKEFRFEGTQVYIRKEGEEVILSAKKPSWDTFFNSSSLFEDDFLAKRDNEPPQERGFFQ